jgi:two-component system, NarL family, nitrate/nitrite response regulator NarL
MMPIDTRESVATRSARPTTVVLADDESMFRASLRQLLSVPPPVIKQVYGVDVGAGFEVIGEAGSGEDALAVVRATRPDLLLVDLSMPRSTGLDVLRELQSSADRPAAVVLAAAIDKRQLLTAVRLGARGVVLKDSTTELLFEAIMCVAAGSSWLGQALVADLMDLVGTLARDSHGVPKTPFGLTARERELLTLVVAGYANKEIARQCSVSEETVKHHLTRMFGKVGASNRLELAMMASQSGLVSS